MAFKDILYEYLYPKIKAGEVLPTFSDMAVQLQISEKSKSLISRSLHQLARDGRLALTKQGRALTIELPRK